MAKYRIAWLPGDGIGKECCDAARVVLDAAGFDAEYIHGDIGWEFWRREVWAPDGKALYFRPGPGSR